MNKSYDKGFGELLDLLKKRPDLLREIIFDTSRLQDLLGCEAARQLKLGEEATDFLRYVGNSSDGYPVTQCLQATTVLCAKGTGISVKCGSKTKY